MDLLPQAVDDFRSKAYWESFFQKRGTATFEWYGEYVHVSHLLSRWIGKEERILVIGCGNSEIGSAMYDAGYRNFVSVDFSDVVIREMRAKNAHREGMQFLLMDVLNMSFEDAAFDVVLDKATLDALLTEDTPEVLAQGRQMASEIERVLRPGGRLVCISLLQHHIAKHIAETYVTDPPRWRVFARTFQAGDESDLCPFFLAFSKLGEGEAAALVSGDEPAVTLGEEARPGPAPSAGAAATCDALRGWALEQQRAFRMVRELRSVVSGQAQTADLWDPRSPQPRYRITVVDATTVRPTAKARVAVLLVPLGREHEFSFAQEEGQLALARGTEYDRLIVAAPQRGHHYASVQAVQQELNAQVPRFCPDRFVEPVPYLSVASEVDQRKEVAHLASPLSGDMVVEDVAPEDSLLNSVLGKAAQQAAEERARSHPDAGPPCISRRLLFLANRNAVQSEMLMVFDPAAAGAGTGGKRGRKRRKNKKKRGTAVGDQAAASGQGAADSGAKEGSSGPQRRREARAGSGTDGAFTVVDLQLDSLDFGLVSLEAGGAVAPRGSSEAQELPVVPLGITASAGSGAPAAERAASELARAPYVPVPYLAFEVHATMAAALALAADSWLPQSREGDAASALVAELEGRAPSSQGSGAGVPAAAGVSALLLGLGGGSLPLTLCHALPGAAVHVAELDPVVVQLADRCFGVRDGATPGGSRLHISAVDGMAATRAAAGVQGAEAEAAAAAGFPRQPHHVVFVDVDSKDIREGLSFPPASFLAPEFLETLREAVRPDDGLLVLNLACRAAEVREQVLGAVKEAFRGGDVLVSDVPDSTNVVVVASRRPRPDVRVDGEGKGAGGGDQDSRAGSGGGGGKGKAKNKGKGKGKNKGKGKAKAKGTTLAALAGTLRDRFATPWHAVIDLNEVFPRVRRL